MSVAFKDRFDGFNRFYLYGATPALAGVIDLLRDQEKLVVAIVDRDTKKQGKLFHSIPVISPEDLFVAKDLNIGIIIVSAYQLEICSFLTTNGVDAGRIFPLLDQMFFPTYADGYGSSDILQSLAKGLEEDEKIYLKSWLEFKETADLGQLTPIAGLEQQYAHRKWMQSIKAGGVCCDVGAYDGVSAREFLASGLFNRVTAFEPFAENIRLLENKCRQEIDEGSIEAKGVALGAERQSIMQPVDVIDSRSSINLDECNQDNMRTELVEIYPLDYFQLTDVTMIKVDVEGFEMDFLTGALQTIKQCRPHVAISAYHKQSHSWEILEFFRENFSSFKCWVGHHPLAVYELEYYIEFER